MRSQEYPLGKPSVRDYPPLASVNDLEENRLTRGQRSADLVARTVGSWRFIIGQSILLAIWAALNMVGWFHHWDPYPFILMNLLLSLQAAYTAPMIMMSQNRKADRDRIEAHNDYLVNMKAEEEIRVIMDKLSAQDRVLTDIARQLDRNRS